MTRLEDWVEARRLTIAWLYIRAGAILGLVAIFDPMLWTPAVFFVVAAIFLRKDELLHSIRSLDNT